jgi:hypothetical protein
MERIRVHHLYLSANCIGEELDIQQLLRNMNRFLWLSMPVKGLMPPIGDTKYEMYIDEKYYREFIREEYCDEEIKYYITDAKTGRCPNYFHQFAEDGYYIFRDNTNLKKGLFSIFLEKRYIGPHGHIDGASFVTFLGPHPIFIDSGGPYKYRDKLRHSYFQSQLAHNTAIFEGPRHYFNKIVASISGPNYAFVASRADMEGGNVWYRIFGQLDSNAVLVVDLAMCADTSTPVQVRYHLAPEVRFNDLVNKIRLYNICGQKFNIQFLEADALISGANPLALMGATTSPRTFDSSTFTLHDQSLALVTRSDGHSEPGNLICHPIQSGRPLIMLAGFGNQTEITVDQQPSALTIDFSKFSNVWAGGRLTINWPTEVSTLTLTLG